MASEAALLIVLVKWRKKKKRGKTASLPWKESSCLAEPDPKGAWLAQEGRPEGLPSSIINTVTIYFRRIT